MYVSSTRQESLTGRAYRFQRFSNSGTYRWTHRKMVVWLKAMPRSAIIWTRSRELKLECEVPPHAQDDDFPVEVPPLEKLSRRTRFHHARRYDFTPLFSSVCTRTPWRSTAAIDRCNISTTFWNRIIGRSNAAYAQASIFGHSQGAWRTIAGYEAIHMIRKGQAWGSAACAKVGLLHASFWACSLRPS